MCVRYVRAREAAEYVAPLLSGRAGGAAPPALAPSWNVVPGSCQPVIGRAGAVRCLAWGLPCHGPAGGHGAPWASGRRLRTIVDVSAGGAASAAWQAVWTSRRVIVPADGWFEWLPAADGRQPWFISRADGEPLFLAALVVSAREADGQTRERFVLVAAAVHAGVVDLHARQPAVLGTPDARAWLDAATPGEAAIRLALRCALPAGAFDRFTVSRAVNEAGREDGPRLIERAAARM